MQFEKLDEGERQFVLICVEIVEMKKEAVWDDSLPD